MLEICHLFIKSAEQQLPAYTFTQTLEDITVQFTIPENKNKADVIYKLKHNHVSLEIKNSGVLLQGDLHAHVDAEASTWTLNGQRSETLAEKYFFIHINCLIWFLYKELIPCVLIPQLGRT